MYLCCKIKFKYNNTMKKTLSLVALAAGMGLMLGSCNTDSYQHQVAVIYPEGAMRMVYADQVEDSIVFLTFDSYHYYAHANNPDHFITTSEKNASQTIQNSYYGGHIFSMPVYFKPNTTDAPRLGYVLVDSKSEMDKWSATAYGTYFQTNWHCISRPAPLYHYGKDDALIESCEHVLRDSAMQVNDTLKFYAFDKWTIESANPEIIDPVIKSGYPSVNDINTKVPCKVAQNLTNDTIRTTLTLKSENGAKTVIKFQQAPRKKAADK